MDSIDFNFIKRLHENARTPVKELAKDVFISAPATSARIEKLKIDGVIKGYHAHFDMVKLGFNISAFVFLSLENASEEELLQFIMPQKNVLRLQSITGPFTHILEVSFKHNLEIKAFMDNLSAFGKAVPHIVTQEHKSYSQAQFTDLLSR